MSIVTVSNKKKKNKITWIDVYNPTPEDRLAIQETGDFLENDVTDALTRTYRSKIVKRDTYIFLSFLLPLQIEKEEGITVSEIDILLSEHTLITIHPHRLTPLNDLLDTFEQKTTSKKDFHSSIELLLREILQQSLEFTHPIIDAVTEDIERLEKNIFSGKYNRKTIETILEIKQNIIEMRGALRGHADVLHTLIRKDPYHTGEVAINPELFKPLIDDTAENWAQLESLKEMIETLENANESFLSHDLNDTMKMLTTFSVMLLPAGVVAGIFGMNSVHMPLVRHELDFWMMLGFVILSCLTVVFLFWKKKWIK